MKSNIKLAGIALMLTFALGVILTVAGAVDTIGETAAEWSPENQAEATIALDRRTDEARATRVYLDVLSSEVVSDTRNTHALMRERERAQAARSNTVSAAMTKTATACIYVGGFAVGCAAIGLGICIGGFAGAAGVERIRQAALLPMTRHLLEGPHITEHGTVTHTATGGTWKIDKSQDALPEHAGHISPTYQALPPSTIAELVQLAKSAGATGGERARARYLVEGGVK